MGKGAIVLGTLIIAFGVWLGLKVKNGWASISFIIIGAALIMFWKEETKVEQRKDLVKK